MTNHSSLDEVDHACMVANDAPVYTQADFDAILQLLDEAHTRLRSVFVGGQEPGVPSEWRIDGLEFRRYDIKLDLAKTKLVQRYRASKFFAGQRRGDKARAKAKANETKWVDLDGVREVTGKDAAGNSHTWKENVGEIQARNLKRQGFDVRQIGKNQYQFASIKEVPKPRT